MKAWNEEEIISTKSGIAVVRTGDGFCSVRFDMIRPDGNVMRGDTVQYRGRVPFSVLQQISKYRRMKEDRE